MNPLEELLQQCTVKLSIPGQNGWGTGFFVAPGLILTCAHVVKALSLPNKVRVRWQQQLDFAAAELDKIIPELDLALLKFTPIDMNLPCVYLDEELQSGQTLHFFGYPDQDFDNGCPVSGSSEGFTGDVPPLIKFKQAQVRPGMSGSALLNQYTGKVCGIVKFTRDRSFDLGGGAIPTHVILEQFPQLRDLQRKFHQHDKRWSILLINSFNNNYDAVKNIYYDKLQELLKQDALKAADQETTKIMLLAANQEDAEGFDEDSLKNVPDSDLLRIDAIWKSHNPKFGFSVQKQIFFEQSAGDVYKFAEHVGWRNSHSLKFKELDEILFDPGAPHGHLPWSWANLRNYGGFATKGSKKRIKLLLSNKIL